MTLTVNWSRAAAHAALGGSRPPRLVGKFNYLQKLPNFSEMKISMSRVTFIPVTKANLAWKHLNFTKTVRKPLNLGVFDPTPKQLRRPQTCLGFVLGLKRMLWVVMMGVVSFGIGWFKPKTAAPHRAGFVKSTSNPLLFGVK